MSIARHHAEWLSLVPVSGPFLSLPVLMEAFPQGLDAHEAEHARLLRLAYEEWDDGFQKRKVDPGVHEAWIKFVLTKTLEFEENLLAEGQAVSQTLHVEVPEHGELLRPDIVLNDPGTKEARMLIQTYPRSQDLSSYVAGSRWKASPDTRMTDLLHGTGVRLGLVTNGEHWMLVDAPKGETTGYASWYASLWREEKITLQAFRSLLSLPRFFGVSDDQTIESLLTKSASNQQEVTEQLGLQVLRAVEMLIHEIAKIEHEPEMDKSVRELVAGIEESLLYESALTVMMRLVFLFCAEERELIPTKPFPVYEQNYSVSMISKQLREIADQHGEELLERRYDAWPRLLSAFRAVYGGLAHDDVSLPAYGGRLFDPDRFPFLEGRYQKTSWRDTEAAPLPVNNRTVLHLLEALQLLQVKVPGGGPAEARRLSFRALDIEQIGHVYEGLLDHTAKRATEPFLGLVGGKGKEPEVSLAALEAKSGEWRVMSDEERAKTEPPKEFLTWLKGETGRTEKALTKVLQNSPLATDHSPFARLRTACGNDESLLQRVQPFAGLLRDDSFGYPVVVPNGSVFVTAGTDRRSSGTHYTPRSLTEPIVQYTLEPLVYIGPAEGKPKSEWKLKSAAELLDLKICDMACGSGAFLVQAARYMSERLMEAWDKAEQRVASGEWREPCVEQTDDSTTLPGTSGLAEGDDAGRGMLQGDEAIPEGGTLRDDQSDSPGGSVDSGEHRRRARTTIDERVSELPEHRQRFPDGSGNSSGTESPSRPIPESTTRQSAPPHRRNQPDAQRPEKQPATSNLNPLATHHTPLITPEGTPATGAAHEQLIPSDPTERRIFAMRIIAQRCLYGVDINPLATEMAKLSLWLLTLAKDKPFEFLDHAMRCGDSLVGLHDLEQLRHYNLKPDADDAVLFGGPFEEAVDAAIALRLKLADLPANTVEDVEAQEALLKEAEDKIARLRCAADLLVAAEFWGENAKDKQEKVRHAAVVAGNYVEKGPTEEFEEKAEKERRGQKMFHWPLEFPEVIVKRGGFDAFVGNPPFIGGSRISGVLGDNYLAFLLASFPSTSGNGDMVAFFIRNAASLLHSVATLGMITTNSISQGTTREGSLDYLLAKGWSVFEAHKSYKWPGSANVFVSLLHLYFGGWEGAFLLDGTVVHSITAYLDEGKGDFAPHRLAQNLKTVFRGSTISGEGFILTEDERQRLIGEDERSSEVIKPFLTGRDINQSSQQRSDRYAIDLGDSDESEAREYRACWNRLFSTVRIQRQGNKIKQREEVWWQYIGRQEALYAAVHGFRRILVCGQVSKYWGVSWVPSEQVFADKVVVFALQSDGHFALLNSCFHIEWAEKTSSRLKEDPNYNLAKTFETFPIPRMYGEMEAIGAKYFAHRMKVMTERNCGLTDTYNCYHDPEETSADIQTLRDLHVEMDKAVAAGYGWDDLDLGHDFYETKQGLRFTISEPARREVLQRLLKLNHERYAEEVKQGLHKKKGRGASGEGRGRKKKSSLKKQEQSLFDKEGEK